MTTIFKSVDFANNGGFRKMLKEQSMDSFRNNNDSYQALPTIRVSQVLMNSPSIKKYRNRNLNCSPSAASNLSNKSPNLGDRSISKNVRNMARMESERSDNKLSAIKALGRSMTVNKYPGMSV